jgi:hypothetical protein
MPDQPISKPALTGHIGICRCERESPAGPPLVSLADLTDELGYHTARRLAAHCYLCDFAGRPVIEADRLNDLLALFARPSPVRCPTATAP